MERYPLLTIFSTFKPFRRHFGTIQLNALRSWRQILPPPEILIFDNAEGTHEAAAEVGARHIPDVSTNPAGLPRVDALFAQAYELASNSFLCYANGDIILFSDLAEAAQRVALPEFLGIGRRIDLPAPNLLSFAQGWDQELRVLASEQGQIHGDYGIDYFLFPHSLFPRLQIPDFAIGRPAWDNWLIYRTRALGIPVVDLTPSVLAIHQEHDYSHHPQGIHGVHYGSDASDSLRKAGGRDHLFSIRDASHVLTQDGLCRNRGRSLRRSLRTYAVTHPWTGAPLRLVRRVLRLTKPSSAEKDA